MSEHPETDPTGRWLHQFRLRERALAAIVFFPALALFSTLPLRPPAVVNGDASAAEFSALRASAHLEAIAAAPHPVGSRQHARVRDYIVDQIETLGLEAEIQTETVWSELREYTRGARIRNVLTRLPGTSGGVALLLVAHYDSVPHSPGASDDGAGVAALLETLRALQTGPRLRSDVIFLFADAEEIGLLGAKAFQQHHPWAAEVALVVNFEARGSRGPSIMFETGPGTGPLVDRFASFVSRPVAASYSYDIYRRLPNDTDFTVFKRAGIPGFNFAFIEDITAYHTSLDRIDRLDLRSLQHHGSQALALARGFGDADLRNLERGAPRIYFNLPLAGLMTYSGALALPLAVLAAVLYFALWYRGFRGRRLTVGRTLLGFAAVPVVVTAVAAVVTLLHQGLPIIAGQGLLARPALFRLGLALVALAVAVALFRMSVEKLGVLDSSAGAAGWWLLLAAATALYLPSSSYLLLWPLLAAELALFALFRGPKGVTPLPTGVLLLLLAVPAAVLWVPLVQLIGAALASGSATILAVIVALLASSLIPQIVLVTGEKRRWVLPLAILAVGLGLYLTEVLSVGYDARRPRPSNVFYAMDAGRQTAIWASTDRRTDSWTTRYLGEEPAKRKLEGFFPWDLEVMFAAAPVLDLPAPLVTESGVETAATASAAPFDNGDGRRLRLHVASDRQAAALFVELRSEAAVTSLAIDGKDVGVGRTPRDEDTPPGYWQGVLYGGSSDGFEVEIGLAGGAPLEVAVADRAYGLPEVPSVADARRPESMRPSFFWPTDLSVVRSSFVF